MNTKTALITGASSGIGQHLAHEFARHGHPVVLVAPVEAELQQVARHLRDAHGVPTHVIAADLERPEGAQHVFDRLRADGVKVEILCNNAGHGQLGNFWEVPLERSLSIVQLNIEAVLRMTRLFLPLMLEHGGGRILNTASIASFMPGPRFAVYHASKAFVLSFSEALATELEDRAITVTALCPGPTDTDFAHKADMEQTNAFQKASVMSPQEVAEIGYKALMKGERVVVAGAVNKAMVFSRHLLPESTQASLHAKMYADTEAQKHHRGDEEFAGSKK